MNYLGLISTDGKTWGGCIPDLQSVWVGGKNRNETLELLEQGLALYLQELLELGETPKPVVAQSLGDIEADFIEFFKGEHCEVLLLEPAPLNPISLEIERLLEQSGLRDVEVARRMGTSPASIHRLKNPFYWGHGTDVLRRFARVMGQKLEISFVPTPSSAAD